MIRNNAIILFNEKLAAIGDNNIKTKSNFANEKIENFVVNVDNNVFC